MRKKRGALGRTRTCGLLIRSLNWELLTCPSLLEISAYLSQRFGLP